MKIRMLVGACGLALTGSAFAGASAPAMHEMKPYLNKALSAEEMAELRAMRAENPPRKQVRSLANGVTRGPSFVYRDAFDDMDGDQLRPQEVPGAYIRQIGLIDTADYTGDFSLIGQLEPDGNAFAADDSEWLGVVDNSVAISNQDGDTANGEYNGPVGGPDPMGVRGGLLNFQKASVSLYEQVDAGFGFQHVDVGTDLYTSGAGEPLFFEVDIYKNKHEDFVWMNLISFTEGANVQAMYVGGSASGAFASFAALFGGSDVIEGPIVVADDPNDIDSAPFVATPYQIPEGTWYTIGFLTDSANWQTMFLKDSVTAGDDNNDGTPNYVMPQNTVTGMRMFEEFGLGLEEGWVQILPGTEDDMMTPDEIEGVGLGFDIDGNPTPNPFTFGGNQVTSIFSGISIDFWRFFLGDDGDNVPNDYWLDDIRMRGVAFEQPDPIPTYRIPYIDDIERWNPGPMGLQGGRWGDISSSRIFVTDTVNDTTPPGTGPDGMPTQAIFYQSTLLNDVFLNNGFRTGVPTTPRVRAEAGDPAIVSVKTIQPNDFLSMTISPVDNTQAVADSVERWGRFLTAATDDNQIPDGLAYVRQRKPIGTDPSMGEYDPTQPPVPLSGPNLTPAIEGSQNTEFINVLAAPSGQAQFDFPTGSFATVEFQVEPGSGTPGPNGEEHVLRVFVNGTELFPNGNAAENFTTNTLTMDTLQFSTGNNNAAGFVEAFFDDVFFDGPTDPINQVDASGMLVDAELADDSPWTLPFVDSLDTYDTGRPAPGQGFADHRLEFLPLVDPDLTPIPQDFETIEFLDTAQTLASGDDVVLYEVVTIDQGAANVPFAETDLVAVPRANLLREYDPDAEVYGTLPSADPMNPVDPTAWYVLDAVNGTEIARGTWFLAVENNPGAGDPNGVTTFDPMNHVDAGFTWSWRKNARYSGTSTESSFVSAAAEGVDDGSRGDIGKFIVKNNTNAESENQNLRQNIGGTFGVFMPLAQTTQEGETAELSFDFYVGQSNFETGMWTVFPGGTVDGGEITALGYGGKGFVSGNDVMGVTPFLPNNGNFFVRIANPLGGAGNPEFIWQDTGVPVPTQSWFNVTMTVNNFSEWEILIDGATIATGVAGDAGNPNDNTNSLDSLTLVRNQFGDNDGNPTDGDIIWEALAFDAPAPVSGDVPDEYHAYRVSEVLTGTAPQIWPVDPFTGTPDTDMMGMPLTRELMDGDFVVIENADPDNGGAPFDQQFVNSRWRAQDDMGVELASGTWDAIGLPGAAGQGGLQNIAGGIGNGNTPPYNTATPFRTILLGNYVSIQDSQVFPRDTWYFDNIALDLDAQAPCPGDLTGNGVVDAGDLAALISQWGQTGTSADFFGNGVGADDLASLISGWGACP